MAREKPTRKDAILAACHECCGYYRDGKHDCESVRCPLYPWMPYRDQEPDLDWFNYSPRVRGKILKSERSPSEEQKVKMTTRLQKARAAIKEEKQDEDE